MIVGAADGQAFVWTAAAGMTNLGSAVSPLGATGSNAYAVNNSGWIVGRLLSQGVGYASYLYKDGQAANLNDLLPANSGWTSLQATKINNNGQVVGEGVLNGQTHIFLMTPTALAVTGVAPATGSTNGSTSVTITGSGIQAGATVTFGGIAATNVVVNNAGTIVTAKTPAHSAGAVTVVVTNPDNTNARLSNAYTYVAPTLTKITVTPANPNIAVSVTQPFVATGTYVAGSDVSTQDLTQLVSWQSGNTAVATISSQGIAKGLAVGRVQITASYQGVAGSTYLTVDLVNVIPGQRSNPGAGTGTPSSSPDGRSSGRALLVLVPGIMGPLEGSCTNADDRANSTFKSITLDLQFFGFQGDIYAFRYGTGLSCPQGDRWYSAEDNHQHLASSALQLNEQIIGQIERSIATHGKPSEIDILAHSQGGAVALLWAYGYQRNISSKYGIKTKIVTLDSPIIGCSSVPCEVYDNGVMSVTSVVDMSDCGVVAQEEAVLGYVVSPDCRGLPVLSVTDVTVYAVANHSDKVVPFSDAFPGAFPPTTIPTEKEITSCTSPTEPWTTDYLTGCHGAVLVVSESVGWAAESILGHPLEWPHPPTPRTGLPVTLGSGFAQATVTASRATPSSLSATPASTPNQVPQPRKTP